MFNMALTFVTPPASPAGVKPYLRTAAHSPGALMLGAGWGHTNTLHAHTGGAIINCSHRLKTPLEHPVEEDVVRDGQTYLPSQDISPQDKEAVHHHSHIDHNYPVQPETKAPHTTPTDL